MISLDLSKSSEVRIAADQSNNLNFVWTISLDLTISSEVRKAGDRPNSVLP